MRKRIKDYYKKWQVGDVYISPSKKMQELGFQSLTIKKIMVVDGVKCPTKAYYDDGKYIETSDKEIGRIILSDGQIRYLRKGTYKI